MHCDRLSSHGPSDAPAGRRRRRACRSATSSMAKLSGTAQCHERPNLAPDVFDPFDEFIKGEHDALGSRQSCKLVQHSGIVAKEPSKLPVLIFTAEAGSAIWRILVSAPGCRFRVLLPGQANGKSSAVRQLGIAQSCSSELGCIRTYRIRSSESAKPGRLP